MAKYGRRRRRGAKRTMRGMRKTKRAFGNRRRRTVKRVPVQRKMRQLSRRVRRLEPIMETAYPQAPLNVLVGMDQVVSTSAPHIQFFTKLTCPANPPNPLGLTWGFAPFNAGEEYREKETCELKTISYDFMLDPDASVAGAGNTDWVKNCYVTVFFFRVKDAGRRLLDGNNFMTAAAWNSAATGSPMTHSIGQAGGQIQLNPDYFHVIKKKVFFGGSFSSVGANQQLGTFSYKPLRMKGSMIVNKNFKQLASGQQVLNMQGFNDLSEDIHMAIFVENPTGVTNTTQRIWVRGAFTYKVTYLDD